ncbi:MAG: formate dehydrogenase accessory sulfurtransferase FdhD [Blastocatellia bacterium]
MSDPRMIELPVQSLSGDAQTTVRRDLLAVEEPLEIRLGFATEDNFAHKSISITMRTPGSDFELATGFLFTEGIITSADQIEQIRHCGKPVGEAQLHNVVRIDLKTGAKVDFKRLERHFYTSSSCGVCGKTSIEALQTAACPVLPEGPIVAAQVIHELPSKLRAAQAVFDCTGGLHASALFDAEGRLLALREDVGRHNALDKLIGAELLERRVPLNNYILLVSGRASFELVQKALMGGLPILAAVGAPSSLAVQLAREFRMTLLGFVRENRFNVYTHDWRVELTGQEER